MTHLRKYKQPCLRYLAGLGLATAILFLYAGQVTGQHGTELDHSLDYLFGLTEGSGENGFDPALAAPVVDLVRTRGGEEFEPEDRNKCHGGYDAFDVRIDFALLLQYLYNPDFPGHIMKPASLKATRWLEVDGGHQELPRLWESLGDSHPVVVTGIQRDTITPDQHSGAYYTYDLGRALILYRLGEEVILLSVSRQLGDSDVGRKGAVVGSDDDWNYLYSNEEGLTLRGLGWVDSYIYEYSSICAYIWKEGRPTVRMGVLQWLRAGWAGINVVKSKHIENGLERFQRDTQTILESSLLPGPGIIARAHEHLKALSLQELRSRYRPVLAYLRSVVAKDPGKYPDIIVEDLTSGIYLERMSQDELVNALMVEVMKKELGRATPLDSSFLSAFMP